jgi:hypothetical protein
MIGQTMAIRRPERVLSLGSMLAGTARQLAAILASGSRTAALRRLECPPS